LQSPTSPHPQKKIDEAAYHQQIDSLRNCFGQHKSFFPDIELAALIALSYYPELAETPIRFVHANTKTTMETRPNVGTLLGTKDTRQYTIFVDRKRKGPHGILVNSLPFNALVGLIGHELAHVLDYEQMNLRKMMQFGLRYLRPINKAHIEKRTDSLTIHKGLGWQLYDWANFAMFEAPTSEQYKSYKAHYYLQPSQIEHIMKKQPLYAAFFED
jgi:hypothetical protein